MTDDDFFDPTTFSVEDDGEDESIDDIRPLVAPAEPAAKGDLDDLDDLLAESKSLVDDARVAKSVRERLKRGGQSTRERLEDEARLLAWQAKNEWKAVAAVAAFRVYNCHCGTVKKVFECLMVHEEHRHLRMSQRWRAVMAAPADLPNETIFRQLDVAMCAECALGKGWDLDKATIWKG